MEYYHDRLLLEKHRNENDKAFFQTNLSFLSEHRGLRPGKLHVFIGKQSAGKSTLARSMIYDFLKFNPTRRMLLILSEEKILDYMAELARDKKIDDEMLGRISCISMVGKDITVEDVEKTMKQFKNSLIFYDNITTSKHYPDDHRVQSKFADRLKVIGIETNCAIIVFAHVKSTIQTNPKYIIRCEDVRGSKTLTNIAEFSYVLQKFNTPNHSYRIITIEKHRAQDIKRSMFNLVYNGKSRIYEESRVVGFEMFKSIMKEL